MKTPINICISGIFHNFDKKNNMKNKITLSIIALIAALSINAQSVVRIIRITPTNICPGEQLVVNFELSTSPAINDSTTFTLYGVNEYKYNPKMAYTELAALPTEVISGVTTYKIIFTMPVFSYNGPVFVQCDGDMMYTNYKNCTVGLQNYTLGKSNETPLYYDLNGNQVELIPNTVLIQVIGNQRRKIIIME